MTKALKKQKDFTEGPLFFRMLLFTLPIMATGILQVLYNLADHIVVGKFSGDPNAVAAVGATGSLNSLIVSLLMGMASGSAVVISQFYGAKQERLVSRAVHTALSFSLIGGVLLSVIGFFVTRPVFDLMEIRPEIIDSSTLYLKIICVGLPAVAVYNFGAAILRAVGDSKTPLIILSLSGILNVALNLVFVLVFNMTVDGVALATIASQYASAIAIVTVLMKRRGESYSFSFANICLDFGILKRIFRFGIPAGIQSALFSVSNVIIMSAINTFPTTTVSARTIAGNIEGIVYQAMNAFFQASMTFSGQNYGAGKVDRIKKAAIYSIIQVVSVGVIFSAVSLVFAEELCMMFVDPADPNLDTVISTAVSICGTVISFYFLCGYMDTLTGILRGIGHSVLPMIVSLIGSCVFRIFWVYVVFPLPEFNTIEGLLISYPISWTMTSTVHLIVLVCAIIKLKKKFVGNREAVGV